MCTLWSSHQLVEEMLVWTAVFMSTQAPKFVLILIFCHMKQFNHMFFKLTFYTSNKPENERAKYSQLFLTFVFLRAPTPLSLSLLSIFFYFWWSIDLVQKDRTMDQGSLFCPFPGLMLIFLLLNHQIERVAATTIPVKGIQLFFCFLHS